MPSPASARSLITGQAVGGEAPPVVSGWSKAKTIGPSRVGERRALPSMNELLAMEHPLQGVLEHLMGPSRAPGVAAADPYGTGAALMGAGQVPMMAGTLKEMPIRAYHASPYDFPKFDINKVGGGQGAQSYGHGLYFAENPAVMEDYHRDFTDSLRNRAPIVYQGESYGPETTRHRILTILGEKGKAQTIADLEASIRSNTVYAPHMADVYRRELEFVHTVDPVSLALPNAHRYEVDIDVDPEQLLDWDKRLREQSPHVQRVLERHQVLRPNPTAWQWIPHQVTDADVAALTFGPSARPGQWTVAQHNASGEVMYHSGTMAESRAAAEAIAKQREGISVNLRDRGENIYRDLQGRYGGEAASRLLNESRVPGLRYLDQGSRFKPTNPAEIEVEMRRVRRQLAEWYPKQGYDPRANRMMVEFKQELADLQNQLDAAHSGQDLTRNIVMFGDDRINILKKYGLLPPVLGASALDSLSRGNSRDNVGAPPPAP